MSEPIRYCPNCQQARPLSELYCAAIQENGERCGWSLLHVPVSHIVTEEAEPTTDSDENEVNTIATQTEPPARQCVNGHTVANDDFICMQCGADILDTNDNNATQPSAPEETTHEPIADWQIETELTNTSETQQQDTLRYFQVKQRENDHETQGYLILYPFEYEPDQAIYRILEKTDHDHIPCLLETGRWQQQFYEVHEWMPQGSLSDQPYYPAESLQDMVKELATALRDLGNMSIRHRNINPAAVLIRTTEPLDLVITDFSSARLSDFDLETVAPLTLSRYSAPETIVGAVSVASDWWGLGIILLEQLTAGHCFAGINDKAFMMHVVTRDIELPDDVSSLNLRVKTFSCE